jgi:hypothetical protein
MRREGLTGTFIKWLPVKQPAEWQADPQLDGISDQAIRNAWKGFSISLPVFSLNIRREPA